MALFGLTEVLVILLLLLFIAGIALLVLGLIFKRRAMLQLYDSGHNELANNILGIDQQLNSICTLDFRISNDIHFSDISYCTLTAFE
jgi:hypothetical protein